MKIIGTDRQGNTKEVEGRDGWSVMEILRDAGFDIAAECGGACACATCHVFVEPEWEAKTGARTEAESAMLNFAAEVKPNSRLSCQIPVTAELEGLVVRMPEGQH